MPNSNDKIARRMNKSDRIVVKKPRSTSNIAAKAKDKENVKENAVRQPFFLGFVYSLGNLMVSLTESIIQ